MRRHALMFTGQAVRKLARTPSARLMRRHALIFTGQAVRKLATSVIPKSADAIVVGAGVTGCSIAFELAKQGLRTVILDSGPSAGSSTSLQGSGILQNYCSHLECSKLAYEGFHHWLHWADYLQEEQSLEQQNLAKLLVTGGILFETPGAQQLLSKAKSNSIRLRASHEHWNKQRCHEELPFLNLDSDNADETSATAQEEFGALFLPHCGHVNNEQLVAENLKQAAERKGAKFVFGQRVAEVLQMRGRCCGVRISGGRTVWAPVVVNAAGPNSSALQDMTFHGAFGQYSDFKVSTQALHLDLARISAPTFLKLEAPVPSFADLDQGIYYRPDCGEVLAASTHAECTLEQAQPLEHAEGSRTMTASELHACLQLRISGLGALETAKTTRATFDVTVDRIPVYDKTPFPGFYVAMGTAGSQFQTCAIAGRLMATIITACENGHDHDNTPIQLDLPLSACEPLDTSIFSRLRTPQIDCEHQPDRAAF